ncbi:MAG: adenylosuccinate synthetase, partial [Parcubacteria group bacterium]|nr:adenylosuccinate synthetase [Parcubacteria group bacterium]
MSGEVWVVRDPAYGDNGKAKVVDYLTGDPRVRAVVRWQGGDNAGHTVVVGKKKFALHYLPCGVIRAHERPLKSVMGRGMAVSLGRLFAEIDKLAREGISVTPENLLISEGAQLTFPYHMALERARESGAAKRGTTARGVGPTYAASCLYQKVMACDVRDLAVVRRRIEEPNGWAASILRDQYYEQEIFPDETMDEVRRYRDRLLPFLGNEILYLNE